MKQKIFSQYPPLYTPLIKSIVLVVVLIIVQPFLWNYVHSSTISLQQKRTQAQQLTNLQARLDMINSHVKSEALFLEQLAGSFPRLGRESQIIEKVEQLGGSIGVAPVVKNIVRQALSEEEGDNENVLALVVTIETSGAASQLLTYVDALEHLPELATVRSWGMSQQISPAPQGGVSSVHYLLTMNVVFYLQQNTNGQ